MFTNKNIAGATAASDQNDKRFLIIDKKLDEFMKSLEENAVDSATLKNAEQKLSIALKETSLKREQIEAFEALDDRPELSRTDLLDSLDVLLSTHQLNSNMTKTRSEKEVTKRIVLVLTGIVIITLGLAMIILPAPPYFEMFTVFYFNDHDGITVMDLISLLIILAGIYVVIVNISKKNLS